MGKSVPELILDLSSDRRPVRRAAVHLLGRRGTEAVGPLIRAPTGSPRLASGAAEALGRIGDPEAVEPLMLLLEHQNDRFFADPVGHVTTAAVEALARDGDWRVRDGGRAAAGRIREALKRVPAELLAAPAPAGTGTEVEAARCPGGRGTELSR